MKTAWDSYLIDLNLIRFNHFTITLKINLRLYEALTIRRGTPSIDWMGSVRTAIAIILPFLPGGYRY
jgi:hypothetical protein